MSTHEIVTTTCDACGAIFSTQGNRFGSRMPLDWAEIDIDWQDAAGERHGDLWHLCPACSGEMLGKVLAKRAQYVTEKHA
jgi:hypothetical protein